ncbi:SusC/RagA family TonB-linked outer membrane protein [Psychroserpens sp. XS_ASV72]|uniref:SusC/RagA family TonB-linked outer membrane protein n=1 Tax=Psychroserpens sp. XS_ASV72 TaxID=3241293 RepID=UPI0035162544
MKLKLTWLMTLFMAFVMQFSFAQEKTITGTVTGEGDGLPLPGVNVIVKGTSRGVQTDFDGNYSIKASEGEVLVFSFVSMKKVERKVGASSTIDVAMAEDVAALDEVVVVAYGTEKASNVTSAIETVKSEDIEQVPNASLDQVLQGQAAGLNIQTSSGQPGASGTVILRGRNSINGNVEPLFIIDGVPVNEDNFRSLNSNDIENVSVLKDASASALYGNRGAGGVIIVTTKTGKRGDGVKVAYRAQYGKSTYNDPGFEVMNSLQMLNFQKRNGIGLGGSISDAEIAATAAQANTDWREIFFRKGTTNSHEINVTTGSESTTSFNSIGYFEQEGITQRSAIQRFTFRSNVNTSLNDRLDVTSNVTINYSKNDFAENEGTGQLDNPFLAPYLAMPFISPYNPDGSLNITGTAYSTQNFTNINGFLNTPFITLNTNALNEISNDEMKIVGRVGANLEAVKNVTVGGSIGIDYEHLEFKSITTPESIRGDITPDPNSEQKGSHFQGFQRNAQIIANANVNYNNTFNDKHYFDLTLGTEYNKTHFISSSFQGFGLNPKLVGSGSAITDGSVAEGADETQYYIPILSATSFNDGLFSYYAVGKYDFDDRYGLQASIRRDAAARFSDTNKWGTFWSVSGKWNIHNESWFNRNGFANELKLRASYGVAGNQRVGGAFNAFSLYTSGVSYNGGLGFALGQIDNPDLKWEETAQFNVGLDFSLLDYKLTGSVDVYKKETTDLFIAKPLSLLSSATSINANLGALENRGVELSMNYQILDGDFKWSVNGNIAYNQNEITNLGDDYDPENPILNGGGTALAEGHAIGTFYRVRWAGVNPADGTPLWLDKDGNLTGTFSTANRVLLDKTQDPKYVGGFGTNLSYKGFALNALFTYAADQWRLNGSYAIVEDTSLAGFANMSTAMLRMWQQPGDVTDIPAFNSVTRAQAGTRYLEDASFLRLRNISLSYSLNKEFLEKTKLFTNVRVYVQGQNLLTWTKWRGFDPESNISSTFFEYPTPKTVTLGFDIEF